MKNFLKLNLLTVSISFFINVESMLAQDQLVVKPVNATTNPLVDSLVKQLAGTGITIQNVRSNLKQTSKAIGTFKAPLGILGIKEGLVMVTGDVTQVSGTNNGGAAMSNTISPSDTTTALAACPQGRQMLNAVLSSSPGTVVLRSRDVATIQFEMIPAGDSISLKYIFASEEYNTFV